jgi:hypothetical protein
MSEEELERKGTSEEMCFQSVAENRHYIAVLAEVT